MFDIITIKQIKTQLGELCKIKRKGAEVSQEALGLSRYTIQKFENGQNATLDTVLKIANHIDLLPRLHQAISNTIADENDISLY